MTRTDRYLGPVLEQAQQTNTTHWLTLYDKNWQVFRSCIGTGTTNGTGYVYVTHRYMFARDLVHVFCDLVWSLSSSRWVTILVILSVSGQYTINLSNKCLCENCPEPKRK
jgi:hypothetical protein